MVLLNYKYKNDLVSILLLIGTVFRIRQKEKEYNKRMFIVN